MGLEALWPLAAILVAFAVLAVVGAALRGGPGTKPSYKRQKAFLSPAERSFYGVLKSAVGDQYDVFAKVRVADVLAPAKSGGRQKWRTAFNRIAMKHFDFVLCCPDTCQAVAAIELDDSTHRAAKTKERDDFMNEACQSASFPLIRFPARRAYQTQELSEVVLGAVRHHDTVASGAVNVPGVETGSPGIATPPSQQSIAGSPPSSSTVPKCPKCGNGMLRRVAARGKHKGTYFWGCQDYPKCRGVLAGDFS